MHIPIATYRIQFQPDFGFKEARQIVNYLEELGVSDIYASPIFRVKKGSAHGYDLVDHNQLNPQLGSERDFEDLTKSVKAREMGWIQDIVPNHMAYDRDNPMLADLLERGRNSRYHEYFDITWDHPNRKLKGRVLAPFLGEPLDKSLEKGEIELVYSTRGLEIRYHELYFPLKIESYERVLGCQLDKLKEELGEHHSRFYDFSDLLHKIGGLEKAKDREEIEDKVSVIKGTLSRLYTGDPKIKAFLDSSIDAFNGKHESSNRVKFLNSLLSDQNFRLCFWKEANEELNYRRFFNVNELICLNTEKPRVFRETHDLVFRLLSEGQISGLRVDHIDGLFDPASYLDSIRWESGDIYVVVEKVLDLAERMPGNWPVQGTTGYDCLNHVNGIFVREENSGIFDSLYNSFTESKREYGPLLRKGKWFFLLNHMSGDIDNLAYLLKDIIIQDISESDLTFNRLRSALGQFIAEFPVYRTYIDGKHFTGTDSAYIRASLEKAKNKNPDLMHELNFLEKCIFSLLKEDMPEEERKKRLLFVMRFQQFTVPLMAKGFEDTLLYNYNRLVSLNEVGSSPEKFGVSLEKFHEFNGYRADSWPLSLSATATHDTKRGEDVRARINVLSELPQEWKEKLESWKKINRKHKTDVKGACVPDLNDEYLLYQILIGTFPFSENEYPRFIDRMKEYIVKAVRESKAHTSWLRPDEVYERACESFVERILDKMGENPFMEDFLGFQKRIAHFGIFNSLSQTLIKITGPGVPDFYQGTELWDFSLVDPDNRRPVDFEKRRSFLRKIREGKGNIPGIVRNLYSSMEDGRIKQFLIFMGLKQRTEKPELYQKGAYIPLEVTGGLNEHIISFARNYGKSWAATIAPRFLTGIIEPGEYPLGRDIWGDTRILLPGNAPSLWKDVITGEEVLAEHGLFAGDALNHFPAALLSGGENQW